VADWGGLKVGVVGLSAYKLEMEVSGGGALAPEKPAVAPAVPVPEKPTAGAVAPAAPAPEAKPQAVTPAPAPAPEAKPETTPAASPPAAETPAKPAGTEGKTP